MKRITGHYKKIGNIDYFTPDDLPPKNPSLDLNPEILAWYEKALLALGKLNEVATRIPDKTQFIKAYIIKEALFSSSIEGINTTLVEVYTHILDQETKIDKNTQLVVNYTQALEQILSWMKSENLPISSRLLCKAHQILMQYGHGDKADPGNFRKQAVKVGALIPPMASGIPALMSALEKFINEDTSITPLIKAGLAHLQFETIHPFLDGNGRIGRLLVVLMLMDSHILQAPILYPSYYFKKHHMAYYAALDRVRTHGDFEEWILFYLKAITESAIDAYQRALDIEHLQKELRTRITQDTLFAKVQETSLTVLESLFQFPAFTVQELSIKIDRAYNTTNNIINLFIQAGFVIETTGQKRNKRFLFKSYLDILEKE